MTGVQTCALPISLEAARLDPVAPGPEGLDPLPEGHPADPQVPGQVLPGYGAIGPAEPFQDEPVSELASIRDDPLLFGGLG